MITYTDPHPKNCDCWRCKSDAGLMSLFVIKSHDNKYFRAKGYGGGGESWVNNLEKAKVYGKLGPANGVLSWWVNNYPNIPAPHIVRLVVTREEPIETDVNKIKKNKLKRELKQAQRNLDYELRQNANRISEHSQEVEYLKKKMDAVESIKKQLDIKI